MAYLVVGYYYQLKALRDINQLIKKDQWVRFLGYTSDNLKKSAGYVNLKKGGKEYKVEITTENFEITTDGNDRTILIKENRK